MKWDRHHMTVAAAVLNDDLDATVSGAALWDIVREARRRGVDCDTVCRAIISEKRIRARLENGERAFLARRDRGSRV